MVGERKEAILAGHYKWFLEAQDQNDSHYDMEEQCSPPLHYMYWSGLPNSNVKPKWISETSCSLSILKPDVPKHMLAIEYELVPQAIALCMARDLIWDLYTLMPMPDEPWMALSYDILVCNFFYVTQCLNQCHLRWHLF